ncbi:unnamed protein product [Pieris brassicae]|uniref:Ig-like domain-containing protein n=1 Tax=Pieris brassicae TaxID=7116 RepID=A0A9P0TVM6_PIEBR|nr:unnamed protein product [Pieris brassicae]
MKEHQNAENRNPRPSLIWYLENTIIDETFEEEDNGVTSNALTFPRLGREHLNARLSCQASNTNLSPPPSKLLILNINLRPLSVQIVKKQEQLSANRSYEVECIVTGSRPAPKITWWIGSRPLRDNVINFSQSNLTRSVVQLVPEAQDHGRVLICHAENPLLRAKSLEDTLKLAVQYSTAFLLDFARGAQYLASRFCDMGFYALVYSSIIANKLVIKQ